MERYHKLHQCTFLVALFQYCYQIDHCLTIYRLLFYHLYFFHIQGSQRPIDIDTPRPGIGFSFKVFSLQDPTIFRPGIVSRMNLIRKIDLMIGCFQQFIELFQKDLLCFFIALIGLVPIFLYPNPSRCNNFATAVSCIFMPNLVPI